MTIHISSRRKKLATIEKEFPGCEVIDVTSKADEPWVMFSPFYPHGDIPVPFSNRTAQSVEGIWQALKVFESEGIDESKLDVVNMKGIKRSVRTRGNVRGHQKGTDGEELLAYVDARRAIYLPSYRWVLENKLQTELDALRDLASKSGVVLLDYETNSDIENTRKPLSHASLVAAYIRGEWPQ